MVDAQRSWDVSAKRPDYGARFDRVPGASIDDGKGDARFIPVHGLLNAVVWLLRCRLRPVRPSNPLWRSSPDSY